MKSKNIPPDIRAKSINEAKQEIKEIIGNLEDDDTNLEESMSKYNRMINLNYHIQEKFRKKLQKVKKTNFKKNDK